MDGCSSWETQWSNDPITPSIFDPLSEEGFVDSDQAPLLTSSSASMPYIIMSPLSPDPGLMGIDGNGSGSVSGSMSRSKSVSIDATSVEDDDGISLIFSDSIHEKKRRANDNTYWSGPDKRLRREDPAGLGSDGGGVNISFRQGSGSEPDAEAIQQMKEMIYRAAAFRPVSFTADLAAGERPKRRNIRISSDPQTVAARQRRERISEKLRMLQKMVPGGSKMDTASMLDEAANYLKFLRTQVKALEGFSNNNSSKDSLNHHNQLTNNYPFGVGNYLLCPPINLQFSSLPFTIPMQECLGVASNTSSFSNLQNPNHVYI